MNEVEIEHAQASRKILSYSWEAGTQCSILVEEGNKPPFFFFFLNVQSMYHFLVSGFWAFLET